MKITAIIPTLNEEEFIEECLINLKNQSYPIDEIILIDSGSEDRTVEIASKYVDKILFGMKNIGYNREIGRLNAKNELIFSTDGDTIVPENWIEKAIKYFDDPDVVAVTGSIMPRNPNFLNKLNCYSRNIFNSFFPGGVNRGCCFLFKNFQNLSFCNSECHSFGEDATLRRYLLNHGKVIYDRGLYVLTDVTIRQRMLTFYCLLGAEHLILWKILK
jgi:cellulose synthase/poly-beta-1,6-N-acetylglucosamine synthase-like glycosyltransferase